MNIIIDENVQRKLTFDQRDGVFLTGECADRCVFFVSVEDYPPDESLYFFYEFMPDNYPATGTGFFRWTKTQFEQHMYHTYGGWSVGNNKYGLKQVGGELWDGTSELEEFE